MVMYFLCFAGYRISWLFIFYLIPLPSLPSSHIAAYTWMLTKLFLCLPSPDLCFHRSSHINTAFIQWLTFSNLDNFKKQGFSNISYNRGDTGKKHGLQYIHVLSCRMGVTSTYICVQILWLTTEMELCRRRGIGM